MKVIKEQEKRFRSVVLRLPEAVMKRIDKLAVDNDTSRQALIAAILEQALDDKNFVLKLKD